MSTWSLSQLFTSLHEDVQQQLSTARRSLKHPGIKGEASEKVWLDLLDKYLPKRYRVAKALVVDSHDNFSQEIDIVVFDRQYSPLIFTYNQATIVPAESVYAVFEVKQTANREHIHYAQQKIASVRRLHRTSLPIPHAGGTYESKPPAPILGGLLTFESNWEPGLDKSLESALQLDSTNGRLDIGCITAHGYFFWNSSTKEYELISGGKPATAFLFKLITQLQLNATVPRIDLEAYAQWLAQD